MNQTLLLVDGSSYLFRAYFALPPLTNSKGRPTGAIYGVMNMLKKLLHEYPADYVGIVFDPKGKTFRHELYPEYKANRQAMPDELREQIEPLFALIKAFGLPIIIENGYEADDVIATLATQAKKEGMRVVISTGDKDLAQLVDDEVTLVNTMNNRVLDRAGVKEKFGVAPEQMVDYLALVGDTSDHIPGIPNVGPKTAAKWLNTYDSIDNLVIHAEEIKGKVGEHLRANIENIPLIKQLVTVKKDLVLKEAPRDLIRQERHSEQLIQLFTELEFKNWLHDIESNQKPMAVTPQKKYTTILEAREFNQWIEALKKAKIFALDTETTDLDPMRATLVGVSFAIEPNHAAYVPLQHDYSNAPAQLSRDLVLNALNAVLQDTSKTVIGQNLKYDIEVLTNAGLSLKTQYADTLLAAYVLNSNQSRNNLDHLAEQYLNQKTTSFESIAGKGAKQLRFNQIPLEIAGPYAAEDADITLQLHHHLQALLDAEPTLLRVLNEIDMPLMPILAEMELHGVLIDAELLHQQSKELTERITVLEKEAYQFAGHPFNLSSPKQLQKILYEELKIPLTKKTPGGQPSTAEAVLQELALLYPLPKVILEHRQLSKLKSTYTDRLPEQINPLTERIHTSYNQAVTSTGRLSSNNPNLQNIPSKTEIGRKIREAFIAPPGYKIIAADYSQVELRIMAHISQDPNLIKAFENEHDIHRVTAAEVFGVPFETVSDEQRRRAKTINFGLLYGMSAFGLSRQLGVERHLAEQYMTTYFERYPKVHDYMLRIRDIAAKQGYVDTLLGRRVYLPDIHSSNIPRRRAAERAAINAPMQGTAADLIKEAMIAMHQWLKAHPHIKAHMIMQVHDELVFEVLKEDVAVVIPAIRQAMERVTQLLVPLIVAIGCGDNWDEAH